MAEKLQELRLESIIEAAMGLPGVKVSREIFLTECFANTAIDLHVLLDEGPVAAGCTAQTLDTMAQELIARRTNTSSAASFLAGLPGGLLMGMAIPADMLQFYGFSLRMAQELAYLYGMGPIWTEDAAQRDTAIGRLILLCGAMFAVPGADSAVRLMTAHVRCEEETDPAFWMAAVRPVGRGVSVQAAKTSAISGIAKTLPLLGGVASGAATFTSMRAMGRNLAAVLEDVRFDYTTEDIRADMESLTALTESAGETVWEETRTQTSAGAPDLEASLKHLGASVSGLFARVQQKAADAVQKPQKEEDVFAKLEKLAKLRDMGAISPEEFEEKKAELLSRI